MRIDLETFFGAKATRSIEDLSNEQRNGAAGISAWSLVDEFPGFHFLQYCGELTDINLRLHPERPTLVDFSSVPMPDSVIRVKVNGGDIRRHGGWKYSQEVAVIRGLNHLPNLQELIVEAFPALTFEDESLPSSLKNFAIFGPGRLNTDSVPATAARHIELLGFDRRLVQDYGFMNRFCGMEILWMNYCNGMEALPPLHPQAAVKEVGIVKARRLKNIESISAKNEIEKVAFRYCPLLTAEEYRCLQQLPKLKQFHVSDKKQEAIVRSILPNVEVTIDRLTSV